MINSSCTESLSSTFWAQLPRPIIGLSPMDGVTDHAFRHIQKKYGQPMLLYTEFTSVEGLCAGASALLKDLLYDESQRPIIAQIYGCSSDSFYQTAILLCQLGFDGIDINMGCPSKSIAHRGAGAGLIQTPALAQQIIRATQAGVQAWCNGATVRNCADVPSAIAAQIEARHSRLPVAFQQRRPIPVSVKTRIGYAKPQVQEWVPRLIESEPAAIGIHGRTLKQGYSGVADWDEIGRAVQHAGGSDTIILGNGDIRSLADAYRRIEGYGVDGALIGRASYGNPYVFQREGSLAEAANTSRTQEHDKYHILQIALDHARVYDASFSSLERYQFLPMRKHLGWYVRNIPAASHLRRTLTQTSSLHEAVDAIHNYLDYRRRWEQQA